MGRATAGGGGPHPLKTLPQGAAAPLTWHWEQRDPQVTQRWEPEGPEITWCWEPEGTCKSPGAGNRGTCKSLGAGNQRGPASLCDASALCLGPQACVTQSPLRADLAGLLTVRPKHIYKSPGPRLQLNIEPVRHCPVSTPHHSYRQPTHRRPVLGSARTIPRQPCSFTGGTPTAPTEKEGGG